MEALKQEVLLQAKPQLSVVKPQAKPAATSLAEIHAMLGRNLAESSYDNLSAKEKAIVLYGAKLKPSDYINKKLKNMDTEVREQIRLSFIAISEMIKAFPSAGLTYKNFSLLQH